MYRYKNIAIVESEKQFFVCYSCNKKIKKILRWLKILIESSLLHCSEKEAFLTHVLLD